MHAILVAESGELDVHQGVEGEHTEQAGVFGLGDIGIGLGLVGADLLVGEDDVDGVAGLGGRAVEEDIDSGDMAVNEAC